eukprot:234670_1
MDAESKCIKDEILQCDRGISNQGVFDSLIIKSIMKCTMYTEGPSKLECAVYDRNYNIIRNTPIGIRHMLALIIYCDFSEFCRFFRETYWKKESAIMHRRLYHYARSLFESVQFFGTEMDPKMKVYHGINTKMSFNRFTAQFFIPISTTMVANIAHQFTGGEGMLLVLKRSKDEQNVPRYIDMQPISMFPQEKEFLFHSAVFSIDDIMSMHDSGHLEGRKHQIFMFNLLQKAIKDEPTKGEWKSNPEAMSGVGDLSKLIDEIAIIQQASKMHQNALSRIRSQTSTYLDE